MYISVDGRDTEIIEKPQIVTYNNPRDLEFADMQKSRKRNHSSLFSSPKRSSLDTTEDMRPTIQNSARSLNKSDKS